MATSKMIKRWIAGKRKTTVKLEREIGAAKTRIKKLEGDLKRAVARERTKPKKKATKKKATKKKATKKKAAKKRRKR